MPPIRVSCTRTKMNALTRDAVAEVARDALTRVACNRSAIVPDDIAREHPSDAIVSGEGQESA